MNPILLFGFALTILSGSGIATDEAEGNRCVIEFAHQLGLHKYTYTDVALLEEILSEDMYLADLESVQTLLMEDLTKKKPLQPMIAQIENSIKKKHPIISEFLCQALDQDLFPEVVEPEDKDVIKRVVHHTYLLERITKEMVENTEFMVDISNHLLAKREVLGIPSDFMDFVITFYGITGQLFNPIKIKTMDWSFQEIADLRERGEITPEEILVRQNGLKFNILEACIAENINGGTDNAMAGIALAINPVETVRVVGDNKALEYVLSQDWIGLYQSWNLAFTLNNVEYLHLLIPKLLIPSVIDAEPNNYMFNRFLALWASANFQFFAEFQQKYDYNIPNANALWEIFSEINYSHAKDYALKRNGVELTSFSYLLGTTYEMLWEELQLLFVGSGIITPEEAQQLTDLLSEQISQVQQKGTHMDLASSGQLVSWSWLIFTFIFYLN